MNKSLNIPSFYQAPTKTLQKRNNLQFSKKTHLNLQIALKTQKTSLEIKQFASSQSNTQVTRCILLEKCLDKENELS